MITKLQKIMGFSALLLSATLSHASGGEPSEPVQTSPPSSSCIGAYVDTWYNGSVSWLCPSSSTISTFGTSSFPNDAISSFKIPTGFAVEACQHGNGSGLCRTYFASVGNVGDIYNDEFSLVRVIRFNYSDFYLTISSDPQYPWSCASSGQSCDNTSIADQDNYKQVSSMNAILYNYGKHRVAGSIINGDLTAFGHDWQFEKYKQFYENDLQMNNYLGLGNHDYANNVNDCWENNCATRMVWHLRDQVKSLNPHRFDYSESGVYYSFPEYRKDHRGSLGYSWEIGNVHFVQLNNYPTYDTNWNGWNFGSARRDFFDINSALNWLRSDLSDARNRGKKIVLNMHDWGDHWNRNDSGFVQILKDYKVSAIFAGHIHSNVGKVSQYTDLHGSGKHLPVFRSGAAVFHDYLLVRFQGSQMVVQKVDSSNGSNYSLSNVGSYSLY